MGEAWKRSSCSAVLFRCVTAAGPAGPAAPVLLTALCVCNWQEIYIYFCGARVCVLSRVSVQHHIHGIAGMCQADIPALVETPPLFKAGLPYICALFV